MTSVGQSIPRSDGMAKAGGETIYSIDYEEAGTLFGKIYARRSRRGELCGWIPAGPAPCRACAPS